eukprot:4241322-Pyramimonas_sp.AAC.1
MGYRSAPSTILPHLRDRRQLGHCCASRGRSTSGEINFHFCNITSWNEVALNFCQELRPISDGFFFVETHLRQEAVKKAKRNAAQIGWRPHFYPALPTPGGGTHRG